MQDLFTLGEKLGARLKARQETVAIAESSSGGLISAALLAVPGASAYFLGGAVIYTARSFRALTNLDREALKAQGIRSASEPFARLIAENIRASHRATWGLGETGAAGPSGNSYGDAPGHSCLAAIGAQTILTRTLETASPDRTANMHAFAIAALQLLDEAIEATPIVG